MYYRYILNEILRHRHRTLVNILGIAVGIALFVSINAVSSAYSEAVSRPFKTYGADIIVQRADKRDAGADQGAVSMHGIRLPFSNKILSQQDIDSLKKIPGISSVTTSLLLWDFDRDGFRTIMGVDTGRGEAGPVKLKEWTAQGRFPMENGEAVLEKHFAKFHKVRVGDRFTVAGREFTVAGLLEIKEGAQITSANIYLTLKDAMDLLPPGSGGINIAYLRLDNAALLEQVRGSVTGSLKGATVTSSDSFLELSGGISKVTDRFSAVISLVALLGALFLVIKSMTGSLIERSPEIGVLKAVGWTNSDVRKQVMGEVFVQAIAGGLTGIIAGYLAAYILGWFSIPVSIPWELNLTPAFAKTAETAGKTVRLDVNFSFTLLLVSLAVSVTAGILAGYLAGRRTLKMKPADILRRL
jgi:putative ABC transport system permease protein